MGERTAAQRLALDGRRLAGEQEVRGFQTRQAQRLEEAQGPYLNAKTDEARAAAEQRLGVLGGKSQADWGVQVTPATKNMDGSTSEGSVIRYNKATGQVERVGGAPPASGDPVKVTTPTQLSALPAGAVYIGPDGKQYRKG